MHYCFARHAAGGTAGRSERPEACDGLAAVIDMLIERQPWNGDSERPESVKSQGELLVAEHGYGRSYLAVPR